MLKGKEQSLGLTHPSTLDSVYNLGTLLMRQGEYAMALVMYERAWGGYQCTLGKWHEETLNAAHHLGDYTTALTKNIPILSPLHLFCNIPHIPYPLKRHSMRCIT